MLLTDMKFPEHAEKDFLCSSGETEHPENILDCFLYEVPPILTIL